MKLNSEYKEMIFIYYTNTLNLDLAMDKLNLTDDQRTELYEDQDFMDRINIHDSTEYYNRIEAIRTIADNPKDSRSLKANLELLKLLFGEEVYKKNDGKKRMPTKIILTAAYPK